MVSINNTVPKFLIKSTQNISLISVLFLVPFMFFNIIDQSYLVAFCTALLSSIYLLSAYRCYKGLYTLSLSLFGIAPILSAVSIFALYSIGVSAAFWSFPTVFIFYFVLPLGYARWVNVAFLLCLVPFAYTVLLPVEFFRFYAVLLGTSIFVYMCIKEIQNQHKALTTLSITDVLTGLHNRSLLNHSLEKAIHLNKRNKIPMTLLMIDLDHFKKINDTFGHAMGDEVLKRVSDIMVTCFRKTDTIFRVGGEEFLVLLNGSDTANSRLVAERLRQTIEQSDIIHNYTVTASIGVSELHDEPEWKDWMARCDDNLFQAKNQGRNQVVCA